ncbi:polyadenylate-binding protein 2-B-like isoform X2 [Branchiostoma lanceolatum]|uniref:polyadenylate-binding protein 2-B-like isoform X1 n=1 Tax=Branchiostoma lanceolatum TaxID=7740 RepID=UPI003451B786
MADEDSLLLAPDLTPDPTQADPLEHEAAAADNPVEDPELEAIKQRVREMEEEAEKLKEMQNEVERQMNLSPTAQRPGATAGAVGVPSPTLAFPTVEEKMEADGRSVYVGNVDYGATAEELEAHFHGCGSINRVTILCDKFTGHPKGFAYIEFADKDSIETAKALDESLFRGRQIKVVPKRTNRPGVSTTDRPPRGRGYRGRGGGFRGFNSGYGGYGGYYPRRSRGFRSRRAAWYSPY